MASQYQNILVAKQDSVGTITLNRPQVLNALSFGLVSEINQAVTEMEQDDDVKVIILTGAGEKAFSAGADIHEMVALPGEEVERRRAQRNEYNWHLCNCLKPTIGALNGLVFGGASVIATTLDIRIGCERTKFRFLAATYGSINCTWTLPVLVGWSLAKELLYTTRIVEADEALRVGLLNRLVPSANLLQEAREMALAIAKHNNRTIQEIKGLLHAGMGAALREKWNLEQDKIRGKMLEKPAEERFKSFLHRKEPSG